MSLKLKSINLDNLSQVSVVPSVTNVDRGYGRRFTVTMGDDSKDVVLKDLFKRAKKLANKAENASELHEVNQFIAKLIDAEVAAAKTYKNRDDCIYKFRSWFHRLFGGAFSGKHLDRFNALNAKVQGKQAQLVETFNHFYEENQPQFKTFVGQNFEIKVKDQLYNLSGEGGLPDGIILKIQKVEDFGTDAGILTIALDNDVCTLKFDGTDDLPSELPVILSEIQSVANAEAVKRAQFLDSLTLIRTIVSKSSPTETTTLNVDDKDYIISRHSEVDNVRIYIQEKVHQGSNVGLLSLSLNPENPSELEFEGEGIASMPESMKPVYDAVLMLAYKLSSSYRSEIKLVRDGLKCIPEWHLNQLASLSGGFNRITYLAHNLAEGSGADFGGLKRDYIVTLTESLQESKSLFCAVEGSLKLPKILGNSDDGILICNEEEAQTFSNLGGAIFAKCYASKINNGFGFEGDVITTGRFFSDALFKAVLSLKDADFKADDRHIKIAKTVLKHFDTEGTPYIKNYRNLLDLNTKSLAKMIEGKNDNLDLAVMLAGYDEYTDEDGSPDIAKIEGDPGKFIKDLQAGIFKDKTLVKKFNGVSLGEMVDPIYRVALGMKMELADWDNFRSQDPSEVSDKIQGSIDRQKIVEGLVVTAYGSSHIYRKKVQWLKNWIENEATDDELKAFLQFVTGGSSFPEGTKININGSGFDPYPKACTCGMKITISDRSSYGHWGKEHWDDTQEHFIRNLKQAIAIEGFQTA